MKEEVLPHHFNVCFMSYAAFLICFKGNMSRIWNCFGVYNSGMMGDINKAAEIQS